MDRFVVREPRQHTDYPQNHQSLALRANAPRNNAMIPTETMYFGGYAAECPTVQHTAHDVMNSSGFGVNQHSMIGAPATNLYNSANLQSPGISGIDPRYLATYTDKNAAYIINGHRMQDDFGRPQMNSVNIGSDYENRSLVAPDRSRYNAFTPQTHKGYQPILGDDNYEFNLLDVSKRQTDALPTNTFKNNIPVKSSMKKEYSVGAICQSSAALPAKSFSDVIQKEEKPIQVLSRSDKLKAEYQSNVDKFGSNSKWKLSLRHFMLSQALYKSGPRAFSGPVEKILKWHKSLQEIGVMVIYEVVAKCVSVRPGDSCSKILVVRDDNGPAMQVVYYEIDFLLPELKPPCTVRVVGRMMAGTCRLQAFNVRPATGDDVATLSRRAAVAAHHVAKLCKDYGVNV